MSVQFGKWNFDGQSVPFDYIEKVNSMLAPYGPDSNERYENGGATILFRAFCTTKESRREKQPCVIPSGEVLVWDGRLDNRKDLISQLASTLTWDSTDLEIVAAAYEKWGDKCFGKLVGDWAVSIWNSRDRSLLLAKDPLGTKQLYYSFDDKQASWSTVIDPLVLCAGKTFGICEEYFGGWLSQFPAAHLTPYVGIHHVPPACSVLLRSGKHIVTKYWDFDPAKQIRYRTDAEYEEHFRAVFSEAVRRRLRSDSPVLAELSGGLDSSAIVCVADNVIDLNRADCPRLDTISWFDSANPGWDDHIYFAKVEEKRGRAGFHINCGAQEQEQADKPVPEKIKPGNGRFAAFPGSDGYLDSDFFDKYSSYALSQGHRVVLSGIGGEQPTGGGMPSPRPELQNLLTRAHFFKLVRQLNAWAKRMKKPRLPVLWDAVKGLFELTLAGGESFEIAPAGAAWLDPGFVRRNYQALCHYPCRLKLLGPLPSIQNHLSALECERRILATLGVLIPEYQLEVRYPFFDRDLREFACAIPCEQLVRVGTRRSLMKRALAGIVPDEVLNRRPPKPAPVEPSKAEEKKEPAKESPASTEWVMDMTQPVVGSSLGIIAANQFLEALRKAQQGEVPPLQALVLRRTIILESWLRQLDTRGLLRGASTRTTSPSLAAGAKRLPAHAHHKSSAA